MKFCSSLLPRLRWWFIAKKKAFVNTQQFPEVLSVAPAVAVMAALGSVRILSLCFQRTCRDATGVGENIPKTLLSCPASELKLQYFLIFNLCGERKWKIKISLNPSKFWYFQFPIFKSYISPFWPYDCKINDLRICFPPPFLSFSSSATSPEMYHVT